MTLFWVSPSPSRGRPRCLPQPSQPSLTTPVSPTVARLQRLGDVPAGSAGDAMDRAPGHDGRPARATHDDDGCHAHAAAAWLAAARRRRRRRRRWWWVHWPSLARTRPASSSPSTRPRSIQCSAPPPSRLCPFTTGGFPGGHPMPLPFPHPLFLHQSQQQQQQQQQLNATYDEAAEGGGGGARTSRLLVCELRYVGNYTTTGLSASIMHADGRGSTPQAAAEGGAAAARARPLRRRATARGERFRNSENAWAGRVTVYLTVTGGVSGGRDRSRGRFRDARLFFSPGLLLVPRATRTARTLGIRPLFQGPFSVAPCQNPLRFLPFPRRVHPYVFKPH
jgi:hypothetical protein